MVIRSLFQKYSKDIKFLILACSAVFAIRFVLSYLPSFGFDMGSWLGWADRLSSLGFSKFYSEGSWTQYTPGYLYYLWFIGKLGIINELAIKIPVIIADVVVGLIIWSIARKSSSKIANLAFFLYVLNPVVIFDGSVWGQIDGLLTLFLFLSAYFLIEKKNFILSVVAWSIAFLIKPQSIAILPAILLAVFSLKVRFKEILFAGIAGAFIVLGLSWPFFPTSPMTGLIAWIIKMGNFYSYTSVFAFNIWSWIGFWRSDAVTFAGLALSTWGIVLFAIFSLVALIRFRKKVTKSEAYYLLFAILSLCFFVFPTKVHERYLFPFFAFLLTSIVSGKSKNLIWIYVITSVASFLNLYYPYSYYYPTQLRSDFLYNLAGALSKIIGFLFLASYFVLVFIDKIPDLSLPNIFSLKKSSVRLPQLKLSKRGGKLALCLILSFAFVTRVFQLGNPTHEYFDEVYHAFTAKVMMSPDKAKAWEWWNTPPAGFAYEWTHPPVAKIGMVLGMLIFGQNSFGWRIPGALLGVGSVFLVYLLAKEILDDEIVALLSSAVFALDGLTLVMSRIGMNDSYILFFVLLSIFLFLKKKNLLSSIFFGLALASKWSAIWAFPILGLVFLSRRMKFKPSHFWFLAIPPLIYLASYAQMFLTGHDLNTWWELQKQMWWYHTGLRATHPYSSPWWSWPLLIRPIYIYTSDEVSGMVSRIYAFGNPLVFWFGLASIVTCFYYAYLEKNKNLGLIIFSYLVFFVPWAFSPRIMFLYHYLPSIPFLAIATGYVLRRNPKIIFGYLFIGLVLFIYFYPHWAGLKIPIWLDQSYYWVPSWR